MILTARGGTYEADKIQILVLAICEINRKDHRETGDIYDCCFRNRCMGDYRPDFWIQRYLATSHQHGNDDHYFLDGLSYPKYQNRDSEAMQVKLDELIRATRGAQNALLDLEELEEDELDRIKAGYGKIAEKARGELRSSPS